MVADLEKQRQGEKDHGETSMDVQALYHPQASRSSAAGVESLKAGGYYFGEVGNDLPGGYLLQAISPFPVRPKILISGRKVEGFV